MTERTTPSRLRANLYRMLDHALETGESLEIERKGRRLRITVDRGEKLDLLRPNPDYIRGDADDLVHMDWSHEWRP